MGEHHFNVEEAQKYGIEEAIIIYNLRFWLFKNRANKKHEHDGYYWTYNSSRAFAEIFPYMSPHKVQKLLRKLELAGVIICGNYNKSSYDRTKWFTLPEFSIPQNGHIHLAELPNQFSQSAQPIPDNNTDSKQDTLQGKLEVSTKKQKDPVQDIPFNSKEWVESLTDSEQTHIALIGYYFKKYAKHNFPTKEVASGELKKNLKPAVYLTKNFKPEDITKTLRHCQDNFSDVHWNLHTVQKQITYVTAKA